MGYMQKCCGAYHDASCRLCAQNSKKRNVPYKMQTQICTKKRSELAELETRVKCTSASPSPSDNSLTMLSSAVSRVLHYLKSVPTIPESWLVCAEQEMTTPLSKLSSLASKMGVSHAEAGSKHAAGSSVGGDPVRRRISGTLPDVTMSDPSAQVFHDTDFFHAASSSECGFGEC